MGFTEELVIPHVEIVQMDNLVIKTLENVSVDADLTTNLHFVKVLFQYPITRVLISGR